MTNTIQNRHSVRQFKDKSLSQEQIDQLTAAFQASPCGMHEADVMEGSIITDKQLLIDIEKQTDNAAYDAPMIFIIATKKGSPFGERDASVAAENIMLQATDLGLGSVYVMSGAIKLNDDSNLLKRLGVDDNYEATVMVPVGLPAEEVKSVDRSERYHLVRK